MQVRQVEELEQVRHGATQELQLVPFMKVPTGHKDTQLLLNRYRPFWQLAHLVMVPMQVRQALEHCTQLPLMGMVLGSVHTDRQLFWKKL